MPDLTESPAAPSGEARLLETVALGLVVVLGVFLRFWCIGNMTPFADEIHTLNVATSRGFAWIATHYFYTDPCIPITLYNRLLLDFSGLTELTFRLPSVIFGAAALPLAAWALWKTISPLHAILTTGFFALSPYCIYLSREARPYPFTAFLFLAAAVSLYAWQRNPRFRFMLLFALCGALAVYYHPVVVPSVLVLWLAAPVLALLDSRRRQMLFSLVLGGVVFGLASLLYLIPLPTLFESAAISGQRRAGLDTLNNGLNLLSGLPLKHSLWLWLALAVPGAVTLSGKIPKAVLILVTTIAVQIGALFVKHPESMEIPWAFFRYLAHLHLFLLLFAVSGAVLLVNRLRMPPGGALAGAMAALILFGGYHAAAGNYVLSPNASFNRHPMLLYANRLDHPNRAPYLHFYRQVLPGLPPGALIESPALFTFPLYAAYQDLHGQRVYNATYANALWKQALDDPRLDLATILSPSELESGLLPHGARYLLVHKDIRKELSSAFEVWMQDPYLSGQLEHVAFLFAPDFLDALFVKDTVLLQNLDVVNAPLIYQDDALLVYDLSKKEAS